MENGVGLLLAVTNSIISSLCAIPLYNLAKALFPFAPVLLLKPLFIALALINTFCWTIYHFPTIKNAIKKVKAPYRSENERRNETVETLIDNAQSHASNASDKIKLRDSVIQTLTQEIKTTTEQMERFSIADKAIRAKSGFKAIVYRAIHNSFLKKILHQPQNQLNKYASACQALLKSVEGKIKSTVTERSSIETVNINTQILQEEIKAALPLKPSKAKNLIKSLLNKISALIYVLANGMGLTNQAVPLIMLLPNLPLQILAAAYVFASGYFCAQKTDIPASLYEKRLAQARSAKTKQYITQSAFQSHKKSILRLHSHTQKKLNAIVTFGISIGQFLSVTAFTQMLYLLINAKLTSITLKTLFTLITHPFSAPLICILAGFAAFIACYDHTYTLMSFGSNNLQKKLSQITKHPSFKVSLLMFTTLMAILCIGKLLLTSLALALTLQSLTQYLVVSLCVTLTYHAYKHYGTNTNTHPLAKILFGISAVFNTAAATIFTVIPGSIYSPIWSKFGRFKVVPNSTYGLLTCAANYNALTGLFKPSTESVSKDIKEAKII